VPAYEKGRDQMATGGVTKCSWTETLFGCPGPESQGRVDARDCRKKGKKHGWVDPTEVFFSLVRGEKVQREQYNGSRTIQSNQARKTAFTLQHRILKPSTTLKKGHS